MDVRAEVPPAPEGVEGPTARRVLAYVEGIDDDAEASVAVLAVLAVGLARSLDRSISTGVAASVIPNLSRQLRETLAEIRGLTTIEGDDPFAVAQAAAVAAAPSNGHTPSLFEHGPAA